MFCPLVSYSFHHATLHAIGQNLDSLSVTILSKSDTKLGNARPSDSIDTVPAGNTFLPLLCDTEASNCSSSAVCGSYHHCT